MTKEGEGTIQIEQYCLVARKFDTVTYRTDRNEFPGEVFRCPHCGIIHGVELVGLHLTAPSAALKEILAEADNLRIDLKLNAHMLAKQCDMARDAEIEAMKLKEELDKTKADFLFLQNQMTQMIIASGQPRDAFSWGMRVSEDNLQKMAKGEK